MITVRKVSGNQNGNYTVNVDATTSLNGFLTLESIQGTFYVGGD